jgi:hypothetical protein
LRNFISRRPESGRIDGFGLKRHVRVVADWKRFDGLIFSVVGFEVCIPTARADVPTGPRDAAAYFTAPECFDHGWAPPPGGTGTGWDNSSAPVGTGAASINFFSRGLNAITASSPTIIAKQVFEKRSFIKSPSA